MHPRTHVPMGTAVTDFDLWERLDYSALYLKILLSVNLYAWVTSAPVFHHDAYLPSDLKDHEFTKLLRIIRHTPPDKLRASSQVHFRETIENPRVLLILEPRGEGIPTKIQNVYARKQAATDPLVQWSNQQVFVGLAWVIGAIGLYVYGEEGGVKGVAVFLVLGNFFAILLQTLFADSAESERRFAEALKQEDFVIVNKEE